MPASGNIKPTHKAIQTYYRTLEEYRAGQITHEGATETAFQQLLSETARAHGWMLVPKMSFKRGGKTIIPDGTLRDLFSLHRGYWEAKDTDDDLLAEIRKKRDKGYPLSNIIFEDTRRAVLFQNGAETLSVDLLNPQALADLLNEFYSHTEPDIEGFEAAVDEFKERVPELAKALDTILKQAHKDNKKFQAAFDDFMQICQTALNPNLAPAAVDEMLVQHLLTERLIRKIFDNPDFTRRNVIAAEVEKVITALVSKSFDREQFLKSLDRFYRAIESTARLLEDFGEKQHFLNTVYERFFQGYSVKLADTHGIVYTPQAIVDFMCASVAEVLEKEFGKTLGDKDVQILDPCTGTGNFIVNLINRIPKKDLPRVYAKQLFANEVMLLPYYIAALNIEHAYFERSGDYEPFEGLCFVDTLDLAEGPQKQLGFMTEENTARVERQRKAPITVIIGNPPYNMAQQNENDNNKNRKYAVVDNRVKQTYALDSQATNVNKLVDPYVKFFRWAADRLEGRDGIVCFVSNNGFIDQIAFDGMRKHLLRDFTLIEHVDLHGDVRKNPKLSGTTHNVFGIRVGVGITIAIRRRQKAGSVLHYVRVPENWRKEQKLAFLARARDAGHIDFVALEPDGRHTWLATEHSAEFSTYLQMGGKETKAADDENVQSIFKLYSLGITTNRDEVVYDFQTDELLSRTQQFIDDYNAEVDRFRRSSKKVDIDSFVKYDRIKWSETLKRNLQRGIHAEFDEKSVRKCFWRPFTTKQLYFDRKLIERVRSFPLIFPNAKSEGENTVICCTNHSQIPFVSQIARCLADEAVGGRGGHCFPYYVYDEDGTNRRENITDWALEQFRTHYQDKKIAKWDIFYYVYGLLHHPGYREKFADNLKRELPRIPFAPDFKAFRKAGKKLAELHLDYDKLEPWKLKWKETEDEPLSYRVEKMKLAKDKKSITINESLTLVGIPPETFEYRLGNRSALDWVIDQYQVSEDKRSGITSDPNREDDPEYIVNLVGQVIRVSVETVKIIKSLPAFQ